MSKHEAAASLAEQLLRDQADNDELLISVLTVDATDPLNRRSLKLISTDPGVPVVTRYASLVRLRDTEGITHARTATA